MIRQYTLRVEDRGETKEHIDICSNCTLPASKCNGECERYKREARKLRQKKKTKKNIILY